MIVGMLTPLTQERFRLVELYAELLHCSNMALVNRLSSEDAPRYNSDGALVDGLDALISIFGEPEVCENEEPLDAQKTKQFEKGSGHHFSPDSPSHPTQDQSQDLPSIEPGQSTEPLAGKDEFELPASDQQDQSGMESKEPMKIKEEEEASARERSEVVESPAGVRMKELFLEHSVLDTCFDLFFEFPWNNFLHNVIYDLVQQALNAKFSNQTLAGQASLKLATSFFRTTKIVDRLLDGVDANHEYGLKFKNSRLGYMGHLVLIGDEVLKALELNSEEFSDVVTELENNQKWKQFVDQQIFEARAHAKLPLGGVMPVMNNTLNPQLATMGAEDDTKPSSVSQDQVGLGTIAGRISKERHEKKDGDGSNEESEHNGGGDQTKHPSDQRYGYADDSQEWDSTRFSSPSSFATQNHSSDRIMTGSIISNPTPFGFDDRFDAPTRTFPQRFADQNGDSSGFDDDFEYSEKPPEAAKSSTTTLEGTPKPGRSRGMKEVQTEVEKPIPEEDEEWGEFAEPSTMTPSSSTQMPEFPTPEQVDEASWNQFDILADKTPKSKLVDDGGHISDDPNEDHIDRRPS